MKHAIKTSILKPEIYYILPNNKRIELLSEMHIANFDFGDFDEPIKELLKAYYETTEQAKKNVIELKIGEFEAEYAGKMQLYLTALDEQVKLPDENPSIGMIICKSKDKTYVEYALQQTSAPIGVATYQLRSTLPDNMKAMLPEPEEIAKRLRIFEQ